MINVRHVIGAKILIVGDVGTGKTRYTAMILKKLLRRGLGREITVIDMAPEDVPGVGGSLGRYIGVGSSGLRYLRPPTIYSPRLRGGGREEVLRLAELNRRALEPLLDQYLSNPTPILVINDLSIYLHRGDPDRVLRCIDISQTFVGNAYYGEKLAPDGGSGITERERALVMAVAKKVGLVINLNSASL